MKKVTNQKVNLSTKAKKILAGVLATSMVFSGTMTAFAGSENVATSEGADTEIESLFGLEIAAMNNENNNATIIKEDGREILQFGKIVTEEGVNPAGVELVNPFAGNEDLNESLSQAFVNGGKVFSGVTSYVSLKGNYPYIHAKGNVFTGLRINKGKVQTTGQDGAGVYTTKDNAVADYNTALANMQASVSQAQDIAKQVAEASPAGSISYDKAYNIVEAISNEAISPEAVAYTYFGFQNGYESPGDPSGLGEFTYPLPVWTKGATVSTWVKVPEDATETTPIFAFVNDTDGLVLRTNGEFMYSAGYASGDSKVYNIYSARFNGETPFANKGEWVYVTLTLKNDMAEVYYNGVKATQKVNGNLSKAGKNGCKNFNNGFGIKAWGDDATIISGLLKEEKYPQILQNFDKDTTDFSDVSNYVGTGDTMIMEHITDEDTQLFIGGDDGTALYNSKWQLCDVDKVYQDAAGEMIHWAGYTAAVEGLQVGAMSFYEFAADSVDAYQMYKAAVANANGTDDDGNGDATETPAPTETVAPTTSPDVVTPTPDVVTPTPDVVTPTPDVVTPTPDVVTPTPDVVTPTPDVVTPTPDVVTPTPDVVTPTPDVTPTPVPTGKTGDTDGDGKIALPDAQMALKIALKIISNPTADQIACGDIDGDGKVTLPDAQKILKEALKITVNFK